MKKLKRTDYIIIAVLVLLAAVCALWLLPGSNSKSSENTKKSTAQKVTYSDYDGKKIGILTGTNMEKESFEHFPNSEYLYYDGYPNLNTALINGTIDAFLADEAAIRLIHSAQPKIDYIKKRLTNNKYAFAFRKNDEREIKLCEQLNDFLAKCRNDGTLDEVDAIWYGNDESKKVVDMSDLHNTNGTVRVITTTTDAPFSYIKDGKNVGYDIDICARFCRAYGYALEIGDVDFQARIPAIESGRYDFTTSMNVTPEREESVMFSKPVGEGGIVVAVRSEDLPAPDDPAAQDYTDYNGKNIGIITGTNFESVTMDKFPDSKYFYYNSYTDVSAALSQGRIDGFVGDEPVVRLLCGEDKRLTYLKQKLQSEDYAFGFAKGSEKTKKYREQFNEMLREFNADGTMQQLDDIWLGTDESKKTVDLDGFEGEKINIVVASTNQPFGYIKDGKLTGYAIDLAARFCRRYGYTPVFSDVDFAANVAGISSGRYDICASSLSVTEERKQTIDFSDTFYQGGLMLVVRADNAAVEQEGFLEGLKNSFERNFIRESRWKLILSGVGMTCLITLLSAAFGTLLAFAVCMFRRTGSVLANAISNIYVKLLQGTPIVVLLMILYYVIFTHSGLSAMWVAVIGFSLNFGAYTSEIMRSGIESVDKGQREAALALGYTENQAFFRFIFPQAAVRFIPVYRGEVISLLKSTSIVGYIAIQDLTKMSDIIRSRTYEAFFPLIVTAVIYFILAWIISVLLKLVLGRIKPHKNKELKGVQTK